jgi:hypothetical protein
MKRLAILIGVVACHRGEPPAGCTVELTGNFDERTTSPKHCPKLAAGAGATRGDTLLQFEVGSRTLRGNIAITLDLGPVPTPGAYNSGTTALWSAAGTKLVPPDGACVFQASNNSTPTGDFVLELAAIDRTTARGSLSLQLFVLPRVEDNGHQTDCGSGTTEDIRIAF